MAQQKAPQTGSYRVGDAWIKVQQGDPLPEGAEAVKAAPEPENKSAPAPENKKQQESETK